MLKNPTDDYEILQVYGPYYKVLRMRQPLTDEQRLAVSYSARPAGSVGAYDIQVGGLYEADSALVLKLLRPPALALGKDPNSEFYDTTRPLDSVRELELKNFYQLPGSRIDPKTFQLSIRRDVIQPYQTTVPRPGGAIPYVELLGLDNFNETSGTPVAGHDGAIDGTALKDNQSATYNVFVDYENGVLFLPDLRPFAPRLKEADGKIFDRLLSHSLLRRDSLVADRDSLDGANTFIYDKYTVHRNEDALYYIDVDFTAAKAGGEIQLGRGNIMEGSDVVTINGQPLVRDRDYTIDYDIGRVVLKRQVGAADNLNIDYSYAPLFQQAGRTLLGSAFRLDGRDRSFGGAFLYESHGAQDLRPRLGEEPSRSLIGDLNTDWAFHPTWVTRLADRLPGVRTTAPSDLRIQAEGGMSFPNPNTRNEVYIDDMEGVRDAVSLSMGAERWHIGSVPSRLDNGAITKFTNITHQLNAEVHWFLPPTGIKEKDLKPTLTDAQGANNNRQALAISVPRRPTGAADPRIDPTDSLWVSLTYLLDPTGLDLQRAQFIELWVNDWNDRHGIALRDRVRGHHVKLHLDLGKVSEDQMRAPGELPNGALDSEDKLVDGQRDGQLSATESNNEDTGVDGRVDSKDAHGEDLVETAPKLDLTTASDADPQGDDFARPYDNYNDLDTRRWRNTNGTEGNRQLNPTPDTEDLTPDGILDTQENYYEYTIDLGESPSRYLVTDVDSAFAGNPNVGADNGWRRYRIPLDDDLRVAFGVPNLALTRHVRLWLEGIIDPDPDPNTDPLWVDDKQRDVVRPFLVLGGLDIVGSRWQASAVPAYVSSKGTTLTLNTVNSVDNADVYVPPFDPKERRNGSQGVKEREQSLALEFTQFDVGDTLEAYKNFSVDENYSRYGKLDWYVTGFDIPNYDPARDTLWYFVRFASDETGRNYYEYRAPVPTSSRLGSVNWARVSLPLTDLSNLKLKTGFPAFDPILYHDSSGTVRYVIKGRPSFTRLRRISVGLINGNGVAAQRWPRGQLWIDEFRATDVAKDVGKAGRMSVTGNVANLIQYNGALNTQDADFLSVGQTRGSGSSQNQLNLGSTLQLHRFFEGTGISLPISFGYSRSSMKPRFTAGDDVVRTGALADASESFSSTRTLSASYARTWSERSNPLLRLTLGGISANMSQVWADARNPTSLNKHTNQTQNVNWDIAPRNLFNFGLPRTKLKLYPLPERLYWHYAMQSSVDSTWDRVRGVSDSLLLRSATHGRSAMVAFGGDTRPLDMLHHHFEGVRNLSLDRDVLENGGMLGSINFGRVVSWAQGLDASYTMQRGNWLRPRVSWNSSYSQNNGPELSRDLGIRAISNGQGARLSWDLPFDKLGGPRVPPPPPVVPARRDTGATVTPDKPPAPARPPFRVTGLFARLGQVSIDGSVSRTSSYSRLSGTPSLFYLLGVAEDPGLGVDGGDRVFPQFGNQVMKTLTRNVQMRNRIDIGFGAALSTRAEVSDQQREANAVRASSASLRFPDFEVEYGNIPTVLRITRLLNNVRLRTALNRSQTWERQAGDIITASDGWQMQPLIGINGDLKNGTRAELKVDTRNTERRNYQLGETRQQDRNTSVNLNLNRSYTQGQKVNVLGRETLVRTSISLGLSSAYEKTTSATRRVLNGRIQRAQFPRDESRISVRGTGSYGFSSNVTGNAALGYLQTHNVTQDIMRRGITVELRAQFTF